MKRFLFNAVVLSLVLAVSGTVQAGGRASTSGNRGSNSGSSNMKNTASLVNHNSGSNSGKNSGSGYGKNMKSFKDSSSKSNYHTHSCKSPNGKYCGSGWCFPKSGCPSYSKCCYSDHWGCNLYYIPTYSCWVWYCPTDQCYYEVNED